MKFLKSMVFLRANPSEEEAPKASLRRRISNPGRLVATGRPTILRRHYIRHKDNRRVGRREAVGTEDATRDASILPRLVEDGVRRCQEELHDPLRSRSCLSYSPLKARPFRAQLLLKLRWPLLTQE